ncbi:MAG: hypothetical protein ACT4QG_22250 [Sporichthyaceae bacterium]
MGGRRLATGGVGTALGALLLGAVAVAAPSTPREEPIVPAGDAPPPEADFSYVVFRKVFHRTPDPHAPLAIPVRARDLLRCKGADKPFAAEHPEGTAAETPERTLTVFARGVAEKWARSVPVNYWRPAGTSPAERLYVLRLHDRVRAAVVLADGGGGWTIRSFAACAEELPLKYTRGDVPIWEDTSGRPADPALVGTYIGSGHCSYQGTVTLTLDGGTSDLTPGRQVFVRDPQGLLATAWVRYGRPNGAYRGWAEAYRGFDANAVLPADAVDTGFRRDTVALWSTADAAYLVGPDRTERWPAVGEGPACM